MSLITGFNIGGFMDLHTKFSIACPPPWDTNFHQKVPASEGPCPTNIFMPPMGNPDSTLVLCYLTYCNIVGSVASLLSMRNPHM